MSDAMAPQRRIVQHGRGAEFFLIFITNLVLTILTLGIYKFWATTRARRYLWSQTEVEGERLEYTGRGMELFVGFMKVMGLFLVIGILVAAVPLLQLPLIISFPFLIGVAVYGAMRYRLSHTRLRGVRFGLDGSSTRHGLLTLGYTVLIVLSLGLASPWARNQLHANLIGNMRYGSARFSYDGRAGPLFASFLLAILLTLPTLGLSWIWYRAREIRHFTGHTTLADVQFGSTISGGAFFWLSLSNLLLLLFTLGLAWPWVLLRSVRFVLERLQLEGELDYAAIQQSAAQAEASGEGLADALDVGAF